MGRSSTLVEQDFEMAPCVSEGPLASAARQAVVAARELGEGPWASLARASAVPFLFDGMERIFAADEEPARALVACLEDLSEFLRAARRSGIAAVGGGEEPAHAADASGEVAQVTGAHYGRLFGAFSAQAYWDEPVRLLKSRLERNGIDPGELETARVLDAGCGGGRYTAAWRLLGAERAVGVDISPIGVADARERVRLAGLDHVDFEEGSVLALPFPDASFDIVFSNGVLHHTVDWRVGVGELLRVLKRGGLGWVYVIENPGGLFWDVIEILRILMRDEPRDAARAALRLLKIPAHRIFYMLDHVMVPINVRLTPDEVEGCLAEMGASDIRRLERGTDFDRIERIWQREPFASVKYGVGENRYVFRKP